MLLRIHSPNIEIRRTMRCRLETRFRIAADPVSCRIRWAGIQIARVSGPLGRPGFRCQITITLRSSGSIFVEELNQDLDGAVSRAALKARRAVLRKVGDTQRQIERVVHEAEVHHVDEKVPLMLKYHVPARH